MQLYKEEQFIAQYVSCNSKREARKKSIFSQRFVETVDLLIKGACSEYCHDCRYGATNFPNNV